MTNAQTTAVPANVPFYNWFYLICDWGAHRLSQSWLQKLKNSGFCLGLALGLGYVAVGIACKEIESCRRWTGLELGVGPRLWLRERERMWLFNVSLAIRW